MVSEENMQVGLDDATENNNDKQVLEKDEHVDTTDEKSEKSVEETKEEEVVEMVEIPKKRLEILENAEKEALEEIKRERAGVINYRKRLEKQRDDFAEIASVRVLSKLLDVDEDVKRILENGKESIPEKHLEGISMMAQRINTIFNQEGVKILEIKEGKTRFDPRYHEPILTQPNPNLPDKTVITVVNAGFIKGDRVLRPAKVIITTIPPEPKEKEEVTSASEKDTGVESNSNNNGDETDNSEVKKQ
ncbi:MAG: nucleotide exchange factor GrpE [Candidatus Heimdallarchaeota archaeon]|nr:nucleotide exchange factor GrpE [Candidatus Heimdallarchaeota archaeon]